MTQRPEDISQAEWQPIATQPRDGDKILALGIDGKWHIAHANPELSTALYTHWIRPTLTHTPAGVPREATAEMIEAGANTPGMKAASSAMQLHQARGYGFAEGAFDDGSPLAQAWRAMYDVALDAAPQSEVVDPSIQI